jgi:hypothetical protein
MCLNQRLLRLYNNDLSDFTKISFHRQVSTNYLLALGLKKVEEIAEKTKIPHEISFMDLIQEGNLAIVNLLRDLERWGLTLAKLTVDEFLLLAQPKIERAINLFIANNR